MPQQTDTTQDQNTSSSNNCPPSHWDEICQNDSLTNIVARLTYTLEKRLEDATK